MRDDFPWSADGFRLKNFQIRPTVRRKTEKNTNDTSNILPYHHYYNFVVAQSLQILLPLVMLPSSSFKDTDSSDLEALGEGEIGPRQYNRDAVRTEN